MKDDIVDRLRRWTHSRYAAPACDLMDEAADEIERLRGVTKPQKKATSTEESQTPVDMERFS
jgi:hypothetical protein